MEFADIDISIPDISLDISSPIDAVSMPEMNVGTLDIDSTIGVMEAQFEVTDAPVTFIEEAPLHFNTTDTQLDEEVNPTLDQSLIDSINEIGDRILGEELSETIENPLSYFIPHDIPDTPSSLEWLTPSSDATLILDQTPTTEILPRPSEGTLLTELTSRLDRISMKNEELSIPSQTILLKEETAITSETSTSQKAFYNLLGEQNADTDSLIKLTLDNSMSLDPHTDEILAARLPNNMILIHHKRTAESGIAAASQLLVVSSLEAYLGGMNAQGPSNPTVNVHWRPSDTSYDLEWKDPAYRNKFPEDIEKAIHNEFRRDWQSNRLTTQPIHVTNKAAKKRDPDEKIKPEDSYMIKTTEWALIQAIPYGSDRPVVTHD